MTLSEMEERVRVAVAEALKDVPATDNNKLLLAAIYLSRAVGIYQEILGLDGLRQLLASATPQVEH